MIARHRAAWLSLVAVLLGVGGVPALHRLVHALEEHAEHAPARRPMPRRVPGHAGDHGHRHGAPGHHTGRAAEEPVADHEPSPRHHHHHQGDDGRDPLRHGRGAPEHLGAALLAPAPSLVPPAPTPTAAPAAPAPRGGILPRRFTGPAPIRGPPSLAAVTEEQT